MLAIIPLGINTDVEELRRVWEKPPNQLNYLDIMGHLAGASRNFQYNLDLLTTAGEAIGTIAHEVRSPTAALQNLTGEVLQATERLLKQIPSIPVALPVTEVDNTGHFFFRTLITNEDLTAWIAEKEKAYQR